MLDECPTAYTVAIASPGKSSPTPFGSTTGSRSAFAMWKRPWPRAGCWCEKFGHSSAAGLRKRRAPTGDKGHLAEVFLNIQGMNSDQWHRVEEIYDAVLTPLAQDTGVRIDCDDSLLLGYVLGCWRETSATFIAIELEQALCGSRARKVDF